MDVLYVLEHDIYCDVTKLNLCERDILSVLKNGASCFTVPVTCRLHKLYPSAQGCFCS